SEQESRLADRDRRASRRLKEPAHVRIQKPDVFRPKTMGERRRIGADPIDQRRDAQAQKNGGAPLQELGVREPVQPQERTHRYDSPGLIILAMMNSLRKLG